MFQPERIGCAAAELPAHFYTPVQPRTLQSPRLLDVNHDVAAQLGLRVQDLGTEDFLHLCAGTGRLGGQTPLATVYSGHQFGVWAGQLGDGRALLLGDVCDTQGQRQEIQLKGSGLTPYSRMGDGWAVLRSSVREYLASQAMDGLGIPTTRALALVASDDPVRRETLETAAIVTRVAPSFLRFGHFEHWAHSAGDQQALLDFVTRYDLPQCRVMAGTTPDWPATACELLREITRRTARLMAQWQLVGFCHGVMNTDNMSILGLTLDYGPFGFMDAFQANHVCNHSDHRGRYAWNAQPAVAQWNLTRLAESLQVLGCMIPDLEAALSGYQAEFLRAYHGGLAEKFGLTDWRDGDVTLGDDWWALLHAQRADFTLAFRYLAQVHEDAAPWLALFNDRQPAQQWLTRYLSRRRAQGRTDAQCQQAMDQVNPLYVLRNHLAQRAIETAQQGDATYIARLMALLRDPYRAQAGAEIEALPPAADAAPIAVSCSS